MTRRRAPFASTAQVVLIALLVLCFALVGQQFNMSLYSYGLIALMALTIVQIGLGNTDPTSGPLKTLRNLLVTFAIVGTVVVGSLLLAPTLIGFGR